MSSPYALQATHQPYWKAILKDMWKYDRNRFLEAAQNIDSYVTKHPRERSALLRKYLKNTETEVIGELV
jgi:hypothetical protein